MFLEISTVDTGASYKGSDGQAGPFLKENYDIVGFMISRQNFLSCSQDCCVSTWVGRCVSVQST